MAPIVKFSRLFALWLVSALLSSFVVVADEGRHFEFTGNEDTSVTVIFTAPEPVDADYISVEVNDGAIFGVTTQAGQSTYTFLLGEFSGIGQNPVDIEIALVIWGRVLVDGVEQVSTDAIWKQEIESIPTTDPEDRQPGPGPTEIELMTEIDVTGDLESNFLGGRWVTDMWFLSWNTLTPSERVAMRAELDARTESIFIIDAFGVSNTGFIDVPCSAPRRFVIRQRACFGPTNCENGRSFAFKCPP